VRAPDGAVRTVERGDLVDGARVVEVEAEALRLHSGDRIEMIGLSGTGEGLAASPRPRPRPRRARPHPGTA